MLCSVVIAQPQLQFPFPVGGQVLALQKGECSPLQNAKIELTNLGTGDSLTMQTHAEDGSFIFNMNDLQQGYVITSKRNTGDTIRIQACDFQESPNPRCIQEFRLDNANPISPKIFDFCYKAEAGSTEDVKFYKDG